MSIFVFDAYGTLFDVHAAIGRFRDKAGPDADRMSDIWRTKQLEYSWTLTMAGRYAPFWTLTERALDFALARVPSVDKALKPQLLQAYFNLDAFPDARAALRTLKGKGHKTGILSNGSPDMLEPLVRHSGLRFDAVLSVDAVKIFKPAPQAYQLAVEKFGVPKERIGFVSSNFWDAAGAKSFGFHVFWINRGGVVGERLGFQPDRVLRSLGEL